MTAVAAAHLPRSLEDRTLRAALACSAWAAGVIHLLVAATHDQGRGMAAGFLAVGLLQVLLAVALVRGPAVETVVAGIWGTAAVMGVYVASRTVGIPGLSHAEEPTHAVADGRTVVAAPEPVGLLDLTVLVLELGLLVGLVSMLPAARRAWTVDALAVTAVVGVAVRLWPS